MGAGRFDWDRFRYTPEKQRHDACLPDTAESMCHSRVASLGGKSCIFANVAFAGNGEAEEPRYVPERYFQPMSVRRAVHEEDNHMVSQLQAFLPRGSASTNARCVGGLRFVHTLAENMRGSQALSRGEL